MHLVLRFLIACIPTALAQGPCFGMECGAGGNPLPAFITLGAALLLEIVSGLAVVFVIVGGAFMVLNFGNETQAAKGKKGVFYALLGFALALCAQVVVSFVVARAGYVEAESPHISIMQITVQSMLIVFNVAFALMMLFYGFRLVLAHGKDEELGTAKKGLFWTITGALVINLSYALVNAVALLGF